MKKFILPLLMVVITLVASCTIGMGTALDLEAPVLTITSPERLSNQKLEFTIEGTCSDNIGVTNVIITNCEPESSPLYKVYCESAIISGDTWRADIKIPKEEEGDITFKCTANDQAGNSSSRSFKQIELFVDDTAPEGLAWYIDKGNHKQIPFMELEELKSLNFNSSVNKDIPQNDEFTIYAKMYDAMSIEKIELYFYDEAGNKIESLTKSVTESSLAGTTESIYTPSFTYKKSDFISKYPSGKHYFRVSYYSADKSGNEKERDLPWMVWYPESDLPGIEVGTENDTYENDTLRVVINNTISTNLFDDDGLKEIHWALKRPGNVNVTVNDLITNSSKRSTFFNAALTTYESKDSITFDSSSYAGAVTDKPITTIKAPDLPMELKLVICALDIKGNWNAKIINLAVDDNAKPLLFIESPNENTIPKIKDGEKSIFQIKGYSLDSKGSSNIKIVFIPNSEEYNTASKKEAYAKQILINDTKKTGHDVLDGNVIIWRQELPQKGASGYSLTEDEWVSQTFAFDFDMINDSDIGFKGAPGREDKFFEIMLVDTDNNQVFRQFKTTGDTTLPVIELIKPEKNMSIIDYSTNDLVIRFKGTKDTGLGMIEPKYKLVFDGSEYTLENGGLKAYTKTVKNDSVEFTLSKEAVAEKAKKNKQPTFELIATDLLNNETKYQLTLILSPLPHITSITSDKPEATYKKGDVVTLQVNFSGNVSVTGTPKLKLFLNSTDRTGNKNVKYATYKRGDKTNSLTFEYTVGTDEVSTQGLQCVYDNPIDLNGGTITTAEIGEGNAHINVVNEGTNLQDNKAIKIDGQAPTISNIEFSTNVSVNSDTKYYVPNSKAIYATLEASEAILISGTPTLNLKAGSNTLAFNFQSINDKKITFVHKVSNTSAEGAVIYNASSYFAAASLNMISDTAGNKLVLKSGTNQTSKVVIDRTSPTTAPAINVAAGSYNKKQNLTISGAEDGATIEYSTDGGVSWNVYTSTVELPVGSYNISTRQYDKAGNVSPNLTPVKVEINDTFPLPSGFTIKKPDGKYKKDTVVTMALSFEDTIYAPNAGDIKIQMTPYGKTSPVKTLSSKALPAGGSTKVEFEYTVTASDSFDGVQISNPTYTAACIDDFGNNPSANTTTEINKLFSDNTGVGGSRPNLTLDGKAPTISTYSPTNNAINSSANNSYKIELTFDEPIYAESGTISLQRKGNWAIPPVLTLTEFNNVYNNSALTVAQKEALMATIKGDGKTTERLNARTGIAVGPYQKITHGLKTSGSNMVPDTSIKFVLAFDLGLYTGSTTLDEHASDGGISISVADIRAAFEAAGYHQHNMDIQSNSVVINGNKMTITVPGTVEDGIEWELIIPEGAIRDATGNTFAGLGEGDYTLWSNKVSKPVVRVDRYSHGYGAKLPNANGENSKEITAYILPSAAGNLGSVPSGVSTTQANSGYGIAPTGYVRVRVDSQTPNATIKYSVVNKSSIDITSSTGATRYYMSGNGDRTGTVRTSNTSVRFTADKNLDYTVTNITDATVSNLAFTSGGTTYSGVFSVGDGKFTTSRKDYICAYATKTNFTQSDTGYEGAFKTLIGASRDSSTNLNFEGGTAKGGEPNVGGFPLKDATNDIRYSKNGYYNSSTKDFIWISYEIVTSNNAFLVHANNYGQNYPDFSYGQITYTYKFKSWSD